MTHKIKSVEPGSIAAQLGIRPGDELVTLNGEEIVDFVDYQALSSAEKMNLVISGEGGQTEYEFEKDDYEPLGLEFYDDMMGKTRLCVNKCRFCFVDQLPDGVRDSLRLKDDDWRLSLMMGNYVTLTNVSDCELERIIRRHASPLYISVHATDEKVRADLIRSLADDKIMDKLHRLAEGGIQFHAQAVVCPGINDGEVLEKTIDDLAGLYPACQSLAVVPVGLTGHRSGLEEIHPFDRNTASALLDMTERKRKVFRRELDTAFVFPSDEMYLLAGRDVPSDSEYEDYAQIDNGVGLLRQTQTEFDDAYFDLPAKNKKGGHASREVCIATGVSAAPFLRKLMEEHPVSNVKVKVVAVENRFFGPSVTVAGLVTGGDLVRRMQKEKCDAILITECMLRNEGDRFLDDMTLAEAQRQLGVDIIPVGRRGEDLLQALLDQSNAGKGKK